MFRSHARLRLSYANVMVTLLAFVVLGGGVAYAATRIAKNSVGSAQLRPNSVTNGKIAPESVGMAALGSGVKQQLANGAAAGPAPVRLHFQANGTPGAAPQPIGAVGGLTIKAACDTSEGLTKLVFGLNSAQAGTIQENFQNDTGPDPHVPSAVQAGNLQIDLPAGESVIGGPPGVPTGTFFRTFATLVYTSGGQTASIQIATIANGTTASCAADGVAVLAGA
jgi:hypothetical protein